MDIEEDISDAVMTAGALIIQTGSLSKAERTLASKLNLSTEDSQDAVAEASMRLVTSAPREIRQSFTAVCSYHRWNHIFEQAVAHNRVDDAMKAQQQIDKLLARVH